MGQTLHCSFGCIALWSKDCCCGANIIICGCCGTCDGSIGTGSGPGCIAAEAGSISAAARGLRRDAARQMGDAPNNKAELYSEVFSFQAPSQALLRRHILCAAP